MNTTDRYSERIRYDKNSNVSNVARYGMNNLRSYGVIDSLEITRNGNQLVAIEDHAEKDLTYTGASDFVDGTDLSEEYTYDGNGRLTKDTNRGIGSITYDPCNNPQSITFTGTNGIEYAYASDGTKLRTVHKVSGIGGSVTRDTTDYLGNLLMRNGHLDMCQFDGGYVSFSNDTIDGWHYYIQDYMGNNRMVVNSDGTIEQVTHYYPYGGVIGDISTNENLQKYKFEGKELDRTFGLDNYDIHARQYFAMAPMWDRIDPLAEKYYGISPYSYCGGDPVNLGDYNGMNPVFSIDGEYLGVTEEGFTGELYIYCGERESIKNLNDISLEELKGLGSYSFDELTSYGAALCYGVALDDNQAGIIINSFLDALSKQPGFQEYNLETFGQAFSLDRITLSGVVYDSKYSQNPDLKVSDGSHFATLMKDAGGYQAGQILMSANRNYESTVENLAATIVYHEYYGHLIRGFGNVTNTHFLAYLFSKDCPYYNGTTESYKEYLITKLNHYIGR